MGIMGSHQITREGEMYYCLLLILLISPAFGRPGSSREYVEELIEQTLTPNITVELRSLLLRRILSEDRALILNTEEKQANYEEDKEYTEKVFGFCDERESDVSTLSSLSPPCHNTVSNQNTAKPPTLSKDLHCQPSLLTVVRNQKFYI